MVFNVENSDNVVPFYYKAEDFKSLLSLVFNIDYSPQWEQNIFQFEGMNVIAELKNGWYPLPRSIKSGYNITKELFQTYREHKLIQVANMDELVMYHYLTELYGIRNVKCQVKLFGNKAYDFVVVHKGKNYFIEFDGLDHFIPVSRYNNDDRILRIQNLLSARREKFERDLSEPRAIAQNFNLSNSELIFWPYWIKKCISNFKIVINGDESVGIGAIYSSDRHFNEFPWTYPISSANLILEYNSQFNISENLIGGFYANNSKLLEKDEQEISRLLLPSGCENPGDWLPIN